MNLLVTGYLKAAPGVKLPPSALRFTFARSSGPGGQNVNKLSTKAVLSVPCAALTEAMPSAAFDRLRALAGARMNEEQLQLVDEHSRSQWSNRQACLRKLSELITEAMRRPKTRRATRPSKGAVQRRITAKKQRGETKKQRQSARRLSGEGS